MTPPDVRNEWTVGYIVNLQGRSWTGGAGAAAPVGSPLDGLRSTDVMKHSWRKRKRRRKSLDTRFLGA
jgi:hypothetical protein